MAKQIINITKVYESTIASDIRIQCWLDTLDAFKNGSEYESIVYQSPITVNPAPRVAKTILNVVENDCIYAAQGANEGRTCILNMADWVRAGGLVEAGSRAQEEELFRRSNLHKHLHQKYYPMKPCTTVYSRDVEFFKQGADYYYAVMPAPMKYDVISAPALCGVPTTPDGQYFLREKDVALMLQKIRQLILIAAEQHVDTLILSAWGCGAFGGPPTHTAELFKQVIDEYDGLIPNITFAILGLNYKPFRDTLVAVV